MKVGNLHDLMSDVADALDLFDGVSTPEQMTSRLERLKKKSADVLEDVDAVRASLAALRDDLLEMSTSLDDEEDDDDDDDDDDELNDLLDEEPEDPHTFAKIQDEDGVENTSKIENPPPQTKTDLQKIEP
jgi:hypothetical protein